MNKLLSSVGLAISVAALSLLAGCQLYFGSGNGSGSNGSGPTGGAGGVRRLRRYRPWKPVPEGRAVRVGLLLRRWRVHRGRVLRRRQGLRQRVPLRREPVVVHPQRNVLHERAVRAGIDV